MASCRKCDQNVSWLQTHQGGTCGACASGAVAGTGTLDPSTEIAKLAKQRNLATAGGTIAAIMALGKTTGMVARGALPDWFGWIAAAGAMAIAIHSSLKIVRLEANARRKE